MFEQEGLRESKGKLSDRLACSDHAQTGVSVEGGDKFSRRGLHTWGVAQMKQKAPPSSVHLCSTEERSEGLPCLPGWSDLQPTEPRQNLGQNTEGTTNAGGCQSMSLPFSWTHGWDQATCIVSVHNRLKNKTKLGLCEAHSPWIY